MEHENLERKHVVPGKMEKALLIYLKGYNIYLTCIVDYHKVNEYKVSSETIEHKRYLVDLNNWSCQCLSFNKNGYTCKHMIVAMLHQLIEEKKTRSYKELKNIDNIFEFIKDFRKQSTTDIEFIREIESQEFPVTIGFEAYKEFYKKE